MQTEQEIARLLLEIEAFIINPTKPFVYVSGMKGPIYCDNRIPLSYPTTRDKIIDAMLHIIGQRVQEFDVIGGVSKGGVPWGSILADRLEKPFIYIRDSTKKHGRQNRIEGALKKGQKVIVVEDTINTGGSSISAIEAVRETGAIVEECIAIYTHEIKKGEEAFEKIQCKLYTTTSFKRVIEQATMMNKITKEQETIVLEWNKDPENWARNQGFE